MKKTFFILFILVTTKTLNAQPFGVPDTLAYLQTIAANKAQFVGQPFSILRDSMTIQIKYFHPKREYFLRY